MNLEINEAPPTIEAIAKVISKTKRTIFFFTLLQASVTILWFFGFLVLSISKDNDLYFLEIGSKAGVLTLACCFVVLILEMLKTTETEIIKGLTEITASSKECKTALKACKENAECDTYAQNVSRQGRSLTFGEVEALRLWNLSSDERMASQREANKRKEAFEILSSGESVFEEPRSPVLETEHIT